jgi:hypothetical protein
LTGREDFKDPIAIFKTDIWPTSLLLIRYCSVLSLAVFVLVFIGQGVAGKNFFSQLWLVGLFPFAFLFFAILFMALVARFFKVLVYQNGVSFLDPLMRRQEITWNQIQEPSISILGNKKIVLKMRLTSIARQFSLNLSFAQAEFILNTIESSDNKKCALFGELSKILARENC